MESVNHAAQVVARERDVDGNTQRLVLRERLARNSNKRISIGRQAGSIVERNSRRQTIEDDRNWPADGRFGLVVQEQLGHEMRVIGIEAL